MIAATAAIAACGSSSAPNRTHTTTTASAGVKFSECMRTHGVPNFPDPGKGGSFDVGSAPGGINPQSPTFQAARQACAKFAPNPGSSPPPVTASQKRAMLANARCMRKHGVPDYPDPTYQDGRAVLNPPPGFDPNTPAFKRALAICGRAR